MGDTAHIDTLFKFLPHTRHLGDVCVASFQWCRTKSTICEKVQY